MKDYFEEFATCPECRKLMPIFRYRFVMHVRVYPFGIYYCYGSSKTL